jgi:dihydroxy-acid dehydratase
MKLRSQNWFSGVSLNTFVHRSWTGAQGFSRDVFDGRPVIGICNSWSELTNCNAHLRMVAEAVKRGVWEAGGLPLEFPTISLGEVLVKPTTMLLRNLMAMDVEEAIKGNPIDGVVLRPVPICRPLWSLADRCSKGIGAGRRSVQVPMSFASGIWYVVGA